MVPMSTSQNTCNARYLEPTLLHSIERALSVSGVDVIFAYVFGSLGTDREGAASDVDIAVYLAPDSNGDFFDARLRLYGRLSRALKRNSIDVVVLNSTCNMLLLYDILTQGTLVYDRAPELRMSYEQHTLHKAIDFKEQRRRRMGGD